jgi:Fe-S cluster assembly protein SufD
VDLAKAMQSERKLALPRQGFAREDLEELSAGREEPRWMLEKRYEGWYHFEELEPPFWPRTDMSRLKWEELIPYAPPQSAVAALDTLPPKLLKALAVYGDRAGLLLQRDSARVYSDLAEDLKQQGVIWTDMNSAVRENPDLIQRYLLNEAVPIETDKYTALAGAFWSGGTFLYVPSGAVVNLPFISVLWLEMPQLAAFPPTLVVAEAGSSVTLVAELLSVGCEGCPQAYHGGVTEIYVGPDAQVRYINIQDFGQQVYDVRNQTALLDRDSRLEWLTVNLGARVSRSTQHSILRHPGGEAKVTGLYLPDGRQHLAFDTLQDHVAPGCLSDLLYQGALLGRSRSVYEGTIRAWPGAQKTNAYQSNRNLLLSRRARADSRPQLEIEANDLRCTHGATVSPVDENQVFYLMSRGIPRDEAVRLVVEGFFRPSLERLPPSLEGLGGRLTEAIDAKLRG